MYKPCPICGKEMNHRRKTCSRSCANRNKTKKPLVEKFCEICGDSMKVKQSRVERTKTCSKDCDFKRRSNLFSGAGNPMYATVSPNRKTLSYIDKEGYRHVYCPTHVNARTDGYVREHIMVMSDFIGRKLVTDSEVVHHKDENRLNNDINNLELMTPSEHAKHHASLRAEKSRYV